MTWDQSLRGGQLTAGVIISYISLRIVGLADVLDYAQRRTIQQVSSLHTFAFISYRFLLNFWDAAGFG